MYRYLLVSLWLTLPQAFASPADTPRAQAFIEAHGREISNAEIPAQREIYAAYLEGAAHPKAAVVRDQPYGPHARHRLDVFPPLGRSDGAAPIVLFVHGGGFVSGDKGNGKIFDNVLDYFAARGMLGININYRLAPQHRWPAGIDDIRAALAWVHANAAEFGGDPQSIFLIGHSAGAAHVAGYVFDETRQLDEGRDGVRGAVLVSGVYSAASIEAPQAYYGDDPSLWAGRLPLQQIDGRRVPLFILTAGLDFPLMQREAVGLIAALCERDGACPRHQQVPGHNHYSIMHHFNTADDSVAHDIAGFIRQHAEAAPSP